MRPIYGPSADLGCADLAEIIRNRFERRKATLHELFARLMLNILCGNSDDRARNHAAFWNGCTLTLTGGAGGTAGVGGVRGP